MPRNLNPETRTLNPIPHTLYPLLSLALFTGCLRSGDELRRAGDEIIACGRLFHTGTRVVLWTDPGGFDAYRVHRRFSNTDQITPSRPVEGTDTPNRYSPLRAIRDAAMAQRVAAHGWSLEDLQQVVDQFVIHYDVCGTSRRCFEVLHDVRGLSVHFMLDVDGTIYQTLDLKERARHAGTANDRSIGVEIANMGAYRDAKTLAQWYATDADGRVRLILPPDWRPLGVDTSQPCPAFRPARNEIIRGTINGANLYQYDYTPQQYAALARLAATLSRVFPNLKLQVPGYWTGPSVERRNRGFRFMHSTLGFPGAVMAAPIWMAEFPGAELSDAISSRARWKVRNDVISDSVLSDFRGLLGHYHVTREKSDPGPAFDWSRVLTDARRLAR